MAQGGLQGGGPARVSRYPRIAAQRAARGLSVTQLATINQGLPTRAGYATDLPAIFDDGENRKTEVADENREIEGIRGPLKAIDLPDTPDAMADFPTHMNSMHLCK